MTYPEDCVKKHSVGCLDRLDDKKEGAIKDKHELFTLERLQWRMGRVGDVEFEAMTRFFVGNTV